MVKFHWNIAFSGLWKWNKGSKCRRAEISKKVAMFWQNFRFWRLISEMCNKLSTIAIFCRFLEKKSSRPCCTNPTVVSSLALIWQLKSRPSSNGHLVVHLMAHIESGYDSTTMRPTQRLYDDPMIIIHLDFDPTTKIVFWQ